MAGRERGCAAPGQRRGRGGEAGEAPPVPKGGPHGGVARPRRGEAAPQRAARMGEPPPPPLLLLLLSLAGRGGAAETNLQQGLPPGEHYYCPGQAWPIPQQVRLTGDGSRATFPVLNKRGGVAFVYHPSTDSSLRGQLTLLARACLPHYILASHSGLTQECPLALVAWGATLPLAKVELAHAVAWLKKHTAQGSRSKPWTGRRFHHLMKRPPICVLDRAVCPAYRGQVLQQLFCHPDPNRSRREPRASSRRATEQLPHPHGSSHQNWANHSQATAAVPPPASPNLQAERKGVLGAREAKGSSQMPAVPPSLRPRLGTRPWITTAQTVGGAAQKRQCPCPDGDHHQAPGGQQLEADKVQEAGGRVRTPRTEEAAWAASALTFLLVTLTLAVLYTRLHRNCRRGQSLYWTMSGEDGRETVAAVIKRRILSAQSRRKKRPRQHRVLLRTTSSESSE